MLVVKKKCCKGTCVILFSLVSFCFFFMSSVIASEETDPSTIIIDKSDVVRDVSISVGDMSNPINERYKRIVGEGLSRYVKKCIDMYIGNDLDMASIGILSSTDITTFIQKSYDGISDQVTQYWESGNKILQDTDCLASDSEFMLMNGMLFLRACKEVIIQCDNFIESEKNRHSVGDGLQCGCLQCTKDSLQCEQNPGIDSNNQFSMLNQRYLIMAIGQVKNVLQQHCNDLKTSMASVVDKENKVAMGMCNNCSAIMYEKFNSTAVGQDLESTGARYINALAMWYKEACSVCRDSWKLRISADEGYVSLEYPSSLLLYIESLITKDLVRQACDDFKYNPLSEWCSKHKDWNYYSTAKNRSDDICIGDMLDWVIKFLDNRLPPKPLSVDLMMCINLCDNCAEHVGKVHKDYYQHHYSPSQVEKSIQNKKLEYRFCKYCVSVLANLIAIVDGDKKPTSDTHLCSSPYSIKPVEKNSINGKAGLRDIFNQWFLQGVGIIPKNVFHGESDYYAHESFLSVNSCSQDSVELSRSWSHGTMDDWGNDIYLCTKQSQAHYKWCIICKYIIHEMYKYINTKN